MTESNIELIQKTAAEMKLNIETGDLASFFSRENYSEEDIDIVLKTFAWLKKKRHEDTVDTLLKLSRILRRKLNTFDNFDFSVFAGEDASKLQNLSTLSPVYSHKNIALIGPPGIGKTHIVEALGTKCCESEMRSYFIKASEMNDKLTRARRTDHVSSTINGFVRPSCLIIDEVGTCRFDAENTKIFFDIVDRRTVKDGPNCMAFTSNSSPDKWKDFFADDDSVLRALDRVFDKALVFNLKGDSYRGKECEVISLHTRSTVTKG